MLQRLLKLNKNHSFFLFGARGTGKSTLINQDFLGESCLLIDLLDPLKEELYLRQPNQLEAEVRGLSDAVTHVVIDEVQKLPKLLDVVHRLIESTNKKFILTGSSARRLKHGGANLLAGRAFVYDLFPFSYFELKDKFDLHSALQYGLLPHLYDLNDDEERKLFLQSYAHTYLKEEVWAEQFVRKLDPFRKFLEVSAQSNGKIINMHNIANDVGVDDKTVKQYFSILEDTLLGFFLEPFKHSFRKRLSLKPKFYYFDPGVTRSLSQLLSVPLVPSTMGYGNAFEHFIILEFIKLNRYFNTDYRYSYLRTKDDSEIDLVVERPGKELLLVEIKSSENIREGDLSSFIAISSELVDAESICLSRDERPKQYKHVKVYPWVDGLRHCFSDYLD